MMLPRWIWRIARSRWLKISLVCLPFVLMAGLAAFYGIANWMGERALNRHVEKLNSMGYVVTLDE